MGVTLKPDRMNEVAPKRHEGAQQMDPQIKGGFSELKNGSSGAISLSGFTPNKSEAMRPSRHVKIVSIASGWAGELQQ